MADAAPLLPAPLGPHSQVLRTVKVFQDLTDAQLAEAVSFGELANVPSGERLFEEGDEARFFYIILEGELQILKKVDGNSAELPLATHRPPHITGEIPLLTATPLIASGLALSPLTLLRYSREAFEEMLTVCRSITKHLLRLSMQKLRDTEGQISQQEKLAGLGKMSAQLAHELNNPAAAAARAAQALQAELHTATEAMCSLPAVLAQPEVTQLAQDLLALPLTPPPADALARADAQDALEAWLKQRAVPEAHDYAYTLLEQGLGPEALAPLAERLKGEQFAGVLRWIGAQRAALGLATQIGRSLGRITELLRAAKGYSFMDQAQMQPVDLRAGLQDTLTLLGHKLRGIEVVRDFDEALPQLMAYGSALNQVWTNLIDNAAYALTQTGNAPATPRLTVRALAQEEAAVVEVEDNGPGIPEDIQRELFTPFFTTKPQGVGTGLGLETSRGIVRRHGGTIDFESAPGRTVFRVRLPLAGIPPDKQLKESGG